MISLIAVGNVSRGSELKQSAKGTVYLKFQVEVPTPQGNWPKRIGVTVFGKQATALSAQIEVGALVSLAGEPQARGYLDKMGKAAGALEMIASQVTVLAAPARPAQPVEQDDVPSSWQPQAPLADSNVTDEDIPF